MTIKQIHNSLNAQIDKLSEVSWFFLKNPQKDFTRRRKVCFRDIITFLLSMEAKSTTNELLDYYKCVASLPSASALRQQRDKILPEAFEFLFWEFAKAFTSDNAEYRGYRLLAVDGSDLPIAADPSDPDCYYPGTNGQRHYSLLHLNALYDLRQKTYMDAIVQKSRKANEQKALCNMIDRSDILNAILLADRGYEGYNCLAHLQEKGWKFLFRIKDSTGGIASGLDLPDSEEFDLPVSLQLSNKQSNAAKLLYLNKNQYRFLPRTATFDFLPSKSRKADPMLFYTLHFRVVRFRISEDSFETVITNLDFPPDDLKQLYAMRWGIETAFRDLKYTIGLSAFHSKKAEHILQEIFARLTMYNFSERITACVVIRRGRKKYAYQANFSAAVHICRKFLRENVHPPDVEALLARFILPVRPDRKRTRKLTPKGFVSFLYRVA